MKSKYEKDYKEADKYVVVNNDDPDLRPIVLSLPETPPLHLIDGYGLPPEEQRFKRIDIPKRLIDLEAEAVSRTKNDLSTNKNNVVTILKIQKTFWELLYSRHKEYKKEIQFIRKIWWLRLNGYFFFNNGKPIYLSGWHFFYLNFWTMDTTNGENRPEFRDRDRKEFIFFLYANTSTETFERIDKDGYAIREKDGTYKMKDVGRRTCYGTIQPKNRRSGNTNKALSSGIEILTRTIGTDGLGIQSYSEDNAKSHFKDKLMPAYDRLPIWLKPNTVSGRTSDVLKLDVGKNDYGTNALGTYADYATTASSKYYDGKKKIFLLTDESGKTDNVSVSDRHDVNKHVVAQGNGSLIFGTMFYPSTVQEITDGAFHYRKMANNSNFYIRVKSSGQTETGLLTLFISGDEGLDEYIDSYGNSVKGEITEYQKKEGFKQTSTDYLQGERDFLLNKGDPESMRSYRNVKKLFPLKYADCWLGEAGDIGFDLEKIDTRLAELRREDGTIRISLDWVNEYGGEVKHKIDDENGRYIVSKLPPESISNKKMLVRMFNPIEQKMVDVWRPMYPGTFTLGADPFRFGSKQDAKTGVTIGKSSRLSDGGISIVWNYDESMDGIKTKDQWDSYRVVMTYRYRASNTDEYNEDVLKAAIFYGSMIFPETNVPSTYEYIVRHGFGGYLLYDVDKYTGMFKTKPGVDSLERSKQDLFGLLRDYIDYRCHKEEHADFLMECKNIKGMEEMRHYDLLASVGMALMGSRSSYIDTLKRTEESDYDLDDFLI